MPKCTPDDMQLTLQDIGNGVPVRKAANQNGIPESTLRSRLKGSEPRFLAHEYQQRLPSYQEEQLCNWLILQDRLAMGLSHN